MMTVCALTAFTLSAAASLAQPLTPQEAFQREIRIERGAAVSEVAFDWRLGKIFIEAEVNGQSGDFIFDTASPTLLDRGFADTLELDIIGQNTGRDANGAEVVTDIAIAETIRLGDVVFHDVPVLIFDFSALDQGSCFIENGVIGSEILTGSAWRIDLSRQTLSIAASADALPVLPDGPESALHDFGYPHTPVIDYAVGQMQDKAFFDTGFAGELNLFEEAAETPAVRRAIVRGSLQRGHGRDGESAGGWAAPEPLTRARLASVTLGDDALPRLQTEVRPIAPTLFGAGLLNTYVVTLDYPGARFSLSPLDEPLTSKPAQDFSIALVGDHAELVRLYEDTPAAHAGLEVGDAVLSVDGRRLVTEPRDARCDTALWLADELDAQSVQTLTIWRDGETRTITLAPER
jgi:predicted aspartyl protease